MQSNPYPRRKYKSSLDLLLDCTATSFNLLLGIRLRPLHRSPRDPTSTKGEGIGGGCVGETMSGVRAGMGLWAIGIVNSAGASISRKKSTDGELTSLSSGAVSETGI